MRYHPSHFKSYIASSCNCNLGSDSSNAHSLIVEDNTIIYARNEGQHTCGGRLFNMRGNGGGSGGDKITFRFCWLDYIIYKPGSFSIHDICRNIIVEDPRPTLQHFFIMMEGTLPWGGCEDHHRDPGDLFGVTFQVRLVDSKEVLPCPACPTRMTNLLLHWLAWDMLSWSPPLHPERNENRHAPKIS